MIPIFVQLDPDCMQVSVLGPFANSSAMLLGNYYGTPAGPVTTPFEAIKVALHLFIVRLLAKPALPLYVCMTGHMHVPVVCFRCTKQTMM